MPDVRGGPRQGIYLNPVIFSVGFVVFHFLVGSYRVSSTELKDTKRDEPDGEDAKAWILTMDITQYLPPFRMNEIHVDR